MAQQLRPAIVILLALTLLTGVLYPLAITAVAQLAFPHQANGSLIFKDGKAVGSELIGQPFDDPKYFWGRLSATGDFPYNSFNGQTHTASFGSNYGPMNQALLKAAQDRISALKAADPTNTRSIPVDLVTASGSGLDPHISLAAAYYQAARVARMRGIPESEIKQLIAQYTEGRQLGFLGEPRVNVLKVNLALDELTKP